MFNLDIIQYLIRYELNEIIIGLIAQLNDLTIAMRWLITTCAQATKQNMSNDQFDSGEWTISRKVEL